MPVQKTFKSRVRARMTKTGESYTTARDQLLRKAMSPDATPEGSADHTMTAAGEAAPDAGDAVASPAPMSVSDEALLAATGERRETWFARLDAWGGTDRGHTAIARWLRDTQGVDGWWSQTITVDYERARGLRAPYQMSTGFSIGASRTLPVGAERVRAAFADPDARRRWLPDIEPVVRPTRAANTLRFDWPAPPSRIAVYFTPKGDRTTVSVQHERLPDAASAEREKRAWRDRLDRLRALLQPD